MPPFGTFVATTDSASQQAVQAAGQTREQMVLGAVRGGIPMELQSEDRDR
jgi:hypothetical protein